MYTRIRRFREYIEALNRAGVRQSLLFPHVAESLRATGGEPAPIRRAKAMAHHLANVDLVVHPHELIAGSILCMWPLAQGLPKHAARKREGRRLVKQYLERKRRSPGSVRAPGQKPMMERDHYDSAID